MKLGEEDPALRRVYFLVRDADGALVANASGFTAGELKKSANGAAFAVVDAPALVPVGTSGLHYYEASAAEALVPGFLRVRLDGTGGSGWYGAGAETVGQTFKIGEVDTTLLRAPFMIYDAEGAGVTGVAAHGSTLVKTSLNGAAPGAAAGTLVEVGGGLYYYQGTVANAAALGLLAIVVTSSISDVAVAYASINKLAGGTAAPIISAISPIDGDVTPGEPGAFSATFKTARRTPITFHLAELGLTPISISIKYATYNETFTVRDAEGSFVWPCDVQADNTFVLNDDEDEADVSILPRGGWPATRVEFKVAASAMAVPE